MIYTEIFQRCKGHRVNGIMNLITHWWHDIYIRYILKPIHDKKTYYVAVRVIIV